MNILIVCAGELPKKELLCEKATKSDYIIAADGGLVAFENTDILPNIIVGDFDSVPGDLIKKYVHLGCETFRVGAIKDETDTQLAYNIAMQRKPSSITFLGATGKRVDHMMSNLMFLKKTLNQNVNVSIEDELQIIEANVGDFYIYGEKGQTVSLLPVNSFARVNATSGLYYPLDNLLLTNKLPRGVSNVFTETKVHICTKQPVFIIKIK